MNNRIMLVTGLCCLLSGTAVVAGQGQSGVSVTGSASGGPFTLLRSVVAAGGGRSDGGGYSLRGSVGQPMSEVSSGGQFNLRAGFWTSSEAVPKDELLFADGFESQE